MNATSRRQAMKTLAAGAAALLALAAGPAQAESQLDAVMARKQITIAIPTDFPPYGVVGTDMVPQGLDIDMARLIATKLGVSEEEVISMNRRLGGDASLNAPLRADELAGAGHGAMFQAADRVNEILVRHLQMASRQA